jgi:sortase A
VFREANSLLKVGVILMALALALLIAAGVVRATLRSEPQRVVQAEVDTKSPGEVSRHSTSEEGSASKKPSSQKQSPTSFSGEEWVENGSSSSSDGAVRQRKEEYAKRPQALVQQQAEPQNSQSPMAQQGGQQTPSEAPSEPEPQPQQHLPQSEQSQAHQQERQPLPGSERRGWPKPSQAELYRANQERRYEVLPGAIMGLTIEALGIHDAPVFDSKSQWALANGVAHHPHTSLPWSQSAQRNVYLAGHRMGFRGTWSRMIFYNLPKLDTGDEVLLRDRSGRTYRYSVSEVFVADPKDVWVMGQVRGRDMLTLQTCTPYPTFEKRLIVRADRKELTASHSTTLSRAIGGLGSDAQID